MKCWCDDLMVSSTRRGTTTAKTSGTPIALLSGSRSAPPTKTARKLTQPFTDIIHYRCKTACKGSEIIRTLKVRRMGLLGSFGCEVPASTTSRTSTSKFRGMRWWFSREFRIWQIFPRIWHPLCGSAAALLGVGRSLRPAVVSPTGCAGGGEIDGLPPAVALQQQRGSPTTRSSVGSVTTLSNLLRMLYSRAGEYPPQQPLLYAEAFSPNTPKGHAQSVMAWGAYMR